MTAVDHGSLVGVTVGRGIIRTRGPRRIPVPITVVRGRLRRGVWRKKTESVCERESDSEREVERERVVVIR